MCKSSIVKKTHLIALLVMIAGGIALVLSSQDLSTYATFDIATKSKSKSKIVGQLSLTDPITYDPEVNANEFSFFMIDQEGIKKKVVVKEAIKRDFEKSEQIVATGRMNDAGEFEASEILLKCPTKYKDEELALRNSAG